jgi:hypothetical protein
VFVFVGFHLGLIPFFFITGFPFESSVNATVVFVAVVLFTSLLAIVYLMHQH